jgi:hypothetical protein
MYNDFFFAKKTVILMAHHSNRDGGSVCSLVNDLSVIISSKVWVHQDMLVDELG